MDPIINKVASSGLVTLDLEEHFPEGERVLFDLEPWLFQGLILREKDFRENLKTHDWNYMLLFSHFEPVAKKLSLVI